MRNWEIISQSPSPTCEEISILVSKHGGDATLYSSTEELRGTWSMIWALGFACCVTKSPDLFRLTSKQGFSSSVPHRSCITLIKLSHPDACRNYALLGCNFLDAFSKVNCFFLLAFSHAKALYKLKKKKTKTELSFYRSSSSYIGRFCHFLLSHISNRAIRLSCRTDGKAHYSITLKFFCWAGSIKRMRKLWGKSNHMIFGRISDIPLNTSRVLSVISTADKFSQVISYFNMWHLKILTGFNVISSTFFLFLRYFFSNS